VFIIGGMYGGLFTATEAAGMGAGGAFLIGLARRRLSRRAIMACLVESVRTSAAIFTIIIGAFLFGYFLVVTNPPRASAPSCSLCPSAPTAFSR